MEYLNFKNIILFAKFNKYLKYIITMVKIPLIRDCSMFSSPQQRRSCRCSLQPPGWLKPPSQPELFSASITLNINCLNTFISNKLYFFILFVPKPRFQMRVFKIPGIQFNNYQIWYSKVNKYSESNNDSPRHQILDQKNVFIDQSKLHFK